MNMVKKLVCGVISAAVALGAASAWAAGTLPAGYTEVQYVESSGSQNLNTGIAPKTTTRVVCDFQYTVVDGSAQCGWGSTGSKESFFFGVAGDGTFKASVSGNFTVSPTGVAADTDRHTFDISMSALKLDGTAFANATTSPFSNAASGNTLYLFALHAGWSPNVVNYASMRIYSCKIYDGETLVRDFVPVVRGSDNKAGLYDLVSESFFGATGDLIAGPEPDVGILPIPNQSCAEGPCRPEFVVSNRVDGNTWTVGGDISSELFDVAYTNNTSFGVATATATGKGEFAGKKLSRKFLINSDELVDVGAAVVSRTTVGNGYVYVFANAAAAQVMTAKRDIYLAECLLVGGGGAGGGKAGGGGGAGGVTNATDLAGVVVKKNGTATLTVGAGGVHSGNPQHKGGNGGATSLEFGSFAASVAGGGGGGSWNNTGAVAGASGGGGAQSGTGGNGTAGIGFAGATGLGTNTAKTGGGGGAGHAGYQADTTAMHAGYGGEGVSNNITGAWVVYGGGGGGGGGKGTGDSTTVTPGLGGLGGGGDGGDGTTYNGKAGVDGLGGGGGGGNMSGNGNNGGKGGNGGTGAVILHILPAAFDIEPISVQYLDVGESECTPEPIVRTSDGLTLLTKDTDYTVSYTNNTHLGNALLTVTGINDYAGKSCVVGFKIYLRYFVDSAAPQEGDGSEESPFATISNAVEKAAAAIDLHGGNVYIHLANGTYNESGLVLDRPISVVGASREGVIINDGIVGKRAFTLSHDEALVSSLTITNFGYRTNGGQGGHIRMTAGTVSDCVIKDGRVAAGKGYGNGGNVWMSGGRLERCYVVNGRANWGGWNGAAESYGMGLYASGGVVDSCFFKNNRDDNDNGRNRGSVYLNGAVTMVNCTVTGGYSRYGEASGIVINNASAKVVNSVAYGNYNTTSSTADSNFGNKNLGRYFHCASVITNASCATWTVLKDEDFVNYHTYSIPPQRSPVFSDLQAYLTSEEYENFDWRLRLTSSAIDAGTTDTADRPAGCATLDLDGNARVSGPSIDLGCWEYDQSQLTCGAYLDGYGTLENGTLTFHATAAGASGAVLYRWDYGNGVTVETPNADHTYSYPAAGYYTARVQASSDGGTTWSDWYTVPTRVAVAPEVMYVDSNCATPAFPYKTRATAANTLSAAVGALTNNVSVNQTIIGGVEIVVLSGSRSNDTGMFLATAVTIRGESSDPADAEIVDGVVGSRAFTITHPDVVVSNLTISGSGIRTNGGQGGHLKMTAGLVANCVIKNGRASAQKGYGDGGNIYMTGGRLERCLVTGGRAQWGGFPNHESCGMGLYATGGVIDNCFFKDNKTDSSDGQNSASVYLNGAVTMVNCMVTGGWSRNYNGKGSGIHINNASAKVVNCIAYGNYVVNKPYAYHTAAANIGSANYGRYFYCAAAFTNTSCATWKVLKDEDFVKYRTFSGTLLAELTAYLDSEEYAGFDWHQRLASPAVEGGTTDPDYRPADGATLDLDGNPRVAGTSIDIGCWEYAQSQFTCGGSLSKYGALEGEAVTFNGFAAGPSSDVVFRWDYGNGVTEETQEAHHVYSYPAAGYFTVKVQASPDGGSTWTDWYTVPVRAAIAPMQMFVDSNCATPVFPYKTRATAANTLGAAVGALTNNISENKTVIDGVDIVVLKGSRSNDTGFFLATAVRVRGESVNCADAEIVDNVAGYRAFTITHPDAVVSNLTISGNGFKTTGLNGGAGGHIWMSTGLVSNCAIKDGRAGSWKGYGNGGNVWMSGGRLERCLVSGGAANWGGFPSQPAYGLALYATGGVIDNCFFKDNKDYNANGRNYGGVCLDGAVTMLNSTVTGSWALDYGGVGLGIYIKNASAKVVNCVAYGNYAYYSNPARIVNNLTSNCGNANLGRYFYCGAAFTNASCATWTVLTDDDFVKYKTFTGTTFADLDTYASSEEYSKFNWHQRRKSRLIDRGTTNTDYRPADSSAVDLDGNLRVDDKTIDLGCWEVYSNQGFFIRLR